MTKCEQKLAEFKQIIDSYNKYCENEELETNYRAAENNHYKELEAVSILLKQVKEIMTFYIEKHRAMRQIDKTDLENAILAVTSYKGCFTIDERWKYCQSVYKKMAEKYGSED